MTDTPIPTGPRVEQGAALSNLWAAAAGLCQTAGELRRAVEAHAMTKFTLLRLVAAS